MSGFKINSMKQILFALTVLLWVSCGSDECELQLNIPENFNQTVYQDNINTINNYLQANNLQANTTSSGLHYIIDIEGTALKPELCDNVSVKYSGFLSDGTVFDSSEGVAFALTNVILGWQEGIPLFGQGGKGTLIIPSYLAYGNQSPSPLIPGNSVLIFNIELLDF